VVHTPWIQHDQRKTPMSAICLAISLALLGVLVIQLSGTHTHAIIPYPERLEHLWLISNSLKWKKQWQPQRP